MPIRSHFQTDASCLLGLDLGIDTRLRKESNMNDRVLSGVVVGVTFLAVVSLMAQTQAPAQGQNNTKDKAKGSGGGGLYRNQAPAPTGPAPKLADGMPDLSGVWLGSGGNDSDISAPRSLKPGDKVVMLPWAEALMKTLLERGFVDIAYPERGESVPLD